MIRVFIDDIAEAGAFLYSLPSFVSGFADVQSFHEPLRWIKSRNRIFFWSRLNAAR